MREKHSELEMIDFRAYYHSRIHGLAGGKDTIE